MGEGEISIYRCQRMFRLCDALSAALGTYVDKS